MVEQQNGVCAICKLPKMMCRLAVDHAHKTGKVRELLCSGCNIILGQLQDNPQRLENMKKYLKKHKNMETNSASH